jgi:serine protease Do
MVVADITPGLQQQLGLEVSKGAVVKDLEDGGVAARAGLRPGDVVQSINGKEVPTARAMAEVVRKAKAGDMLRLKVNRQGAGLFVAIRKP